MSTSELWSTETVPQRVCTTRGAVDATVVDRIMRAIDQVLRRHLIDEAVRVRLTAPLCSEGPMLAQVNTDIRGTPIRVQVPGPGGFIASFIADRLDRQLDRLTTEGTPRYWPDPARLPLAAVTDEHPIVRRKYCELRTVQLSEAARTMDAMDYDAHLYTDAATGADAVIHWAGPLGLRLACQHRMRPPETDLPHTVHPLPIPRLSESEAAARLCRYGLPFLFFTDPRGGRGQLLYRRYDGDLALVLPDGDGVRS